MCNGGHMAVLWQPYGGPMEQRGTLRDPKAQTNPQTQYRSRYFRVPEGAGLLPDKKYDFFCVVRVGDDAFTCTASERTAYPHNQTPIYLI